MTIDRQQVQAITRAVTEALANINEAITTPAVEATQGYRTQLETQGFAPAVAEQMAIQYHGELMRVLFAQFQGGPKK